MMENIFLSFFNTSIIACLPLLAVILARFAFKRMPKDLTCLLWLLVAVRLALPFSLSAPFSLLPEAEPINAEALTLSEEEKEQAPAVKHVINPAPVSPMSEESEPAGNGTPIVNNTPVVDEAPAPSEAPAPVIDNREEPVSPAVTAEEPGENADVLGKVINCASIAWVAGMAGMALYGVIGYVRLRRRTRVCEKKEKGVWLCDHITEPFILGVFRPRIMLPSSIAPEDEKYVLLHERAHISRGDHIWRVLAFVLLALHWYNPLVWVSFFLFSRDTEFACDERVVRENGEEIKKPYARTLIAYSTMPRNAFSASLSFGGKGIAARLQNMLHYKKPAVWVCIAFALTCAVIALCLMTLPVDGNDSEGGETPVSATEGTEETEITEPTENTEATENTEPTEPTEPTDSTEPTDNTEPLDTVPEQTGPELPDIDSDYDVIIRDAPLEGTEVECEQHTIWHSTGEDYGEILDMLTVPLYYEGRLCLERFGDVEVASSFSELEELLYETTYAIHGEYDYEKECDFYCPQMFQNTMRNNMLNDFTETFFQSNSLIVLYTDQFSRDISVILNGNEISLQYKYLINDNALEYFLDNGNFAESDPSDSMPTVDIFPKLEWILLAVPKEMVESVDTFSIYASIEPIYID